MSKRLQVLMPEAQYGAIRRLARSQGVSVGEWVRRVLDDACRRTSARSPQDRIARLRELSRHRFPSGDIQAMNREIGLGYVAEPAEPPYGAPTAAPQEPDDPRGAGRSRP
jgi:hypothetical protein